MRRRDLATKILLACLSKPKVVTKDIHAQLKETIAEHKRIMRQWEKLLSQEQDDSFEMPDKQAA